ncbi:MAG: hypothetical protein GF344_07445 [Chitinivibrionales bacterium]|nr:hypothetical protein [Chitinivibrionales bacterium]
MAPYLFGDHTVLRPLKWYTTLHTHKGRAATGMFLAEGRRVVEQIAATKPEAVDEVLFTEDAGPVKSAEFPLRQLTAAQIRRIASTKTPQGLIAVVRAPTDIESSKIPEKPGSRILLLEDIQDPGNVGTLVRTAAAMGYDGIVASDKCADPLTPKAVQACAGSLYTVWIRRTRQYLSMVHDLQKRGFELIATTAGGMSCRRWRPDGSLVLMLGNEGNGLSPSLLALADTRLAIPHAAERVESLNVAAAGAICMFISSAVSTK